MISKVLGLDSVHVHEHIYVDPMYFVFALVQCLLQNSLLFICKKCKKHAVTCSIKVEGGDWV